MFFSPSGFPNNTLYTPLSSLRTSAYPCHLSFHGCSHIKPRPDLLTPWCRVLLEKLTGLQLVKKFPAFHGTRRFITALTNVRHLSLSWASPIRSIYPHPTSWRSILILSTHLRLGLPSGPLPSGFPTLYTRIPKATYTHSECVMLSASALQQWLQEWAFLLHYAYRMLPVLLYLVRLVFIDSFNIIPDLVRTTRMLVLYFFMFYLSCYIC